MCEICSNKKKTFQLQIIRSIIKKSDFANNLKFNGDFNSNSLKSILNNVIIAIEELSKTIKLVEKSIGFFFGSDL